MPVFVRNVLVGIAFMPLTLLLCLLAAMRFPAMDTVTLWTPTGVRAAVAKVILDRAEYGKNGLPALERVVRLDPGSALAWQRLCGTSSNPIERRMEDCRKSVALHPTPWTYRGLANAQEQTQDWAGAEETMRMAQSRADTIDNDPSYFLRELGRLEMVNGHLDKSLADLLQAEKFDGRDAEFAKDDDGDAAENLEYDREYLVVLYDRMHQPKQSDAMCRKAMPKSDKPCGCSLDAKNRLHCAAWPPVKDED